MARPNDPAQMALPFDHPESVNKPALAPGRHSLFFALIPPADTAERAFRLACDLHRQHDLPVMPRPRPLLHMTLCGIGEIDRLPEGIIPLVQRAAESLGAAAFRMRLDRVLTFRQRQHPLVLAGEEGNDAFRMLHIRLGLALRNSGLKVAIQRSLQPHMTLVYGRKPLTEVRLATPIELRATDFVLVRSHHGESRHDHLGRWPLLQN